MTQVGFDVLLLLALLVSSKRAPPTSSAPSSTRSDLPAGREVSRIRTGEFHLPEWTVRRRALALAALRGLNPPVPEELLDRVALSLLAQWAHETNRGLSEFNYNLGGWTARRSDDFFTAADVLTPGKPAFRWTAYPDLPTAVDDQVRRLAKGFPTAFRMLLERPESSAWIEQLGRSGYYTARPSDYARAWAMHRTELGRIP